MKTKMVKRLTGLFVSVLLVGVTATSVLATSGMVHQGGCCDAKTMTQLGIAPEQIAKLNAFCSEQGQKVTKENSRYDIEDGWVVK